MISFTNPFKVRREVNAAHDLYVATIKSARDPWLFNDCGVPDTPEGRFEALTLMAFIVLNRLKDIEGAAGVSQAYFDVMFEDIDANLREMGVGEATIAKRMKKLAGSFYGRVKTYDEALTSDEPSQWPDTIKRYLFNETEVSEEIVAAVASFSADIAQNIATQPADNLVAGKITFNGNRDIINKAT
jgi:cytochrome b pre-mRNA-processing protein 3